MAQIKRLRNLRKKRSSRRKQKVVSFNKTYPHNGISNTVVMKHDYYKVINWSASTSATSYLFRLNSLYDPDQTGVGNQPYYFDQMAALFNKYCVYGVNVKATFLVNSGTNAVLGFKAQPDTSSLSDASLALERPENKTVILAPGQRSVTSQRYFALNQLFGVRKETILDENDYKAVPTTNPLNVHYLQVYAGPTDNATTTSGTIVMRFTFYTKWSDRVRQSQS